MAKLISNIKLRGTVDNLTYLQTKDGMQVRKKKRSISKETLQNDPRYKRLRENMTEFGLAAASSKLLRTVVTDALLDCSDKRLTSRLIKSCMEVIKSDPTSRRGSRTFTKGKASLLKDFNFNDASVLALVFKKLTSSTMDRTAGKLVIEIPGFIPEDSILRPPGTTHFKFHSMAAEINFETGTYTIKKNESDPIQNEDHLPVAPISFIHEVTPNSANPIFLLLGIRFYELSNGNYYPFKNSAFNALSIVNASSV